MLTTTVEIKEPPSVLIPILYEKRIGLPIIAFAFIGVLALRSTAMDRGEVASREWQAKLCKIKDPTPFLY